MFGYVTICKPELKIKDYCEYKGYYCGLCRTLRRRYGPAGQLALNYDMTFLVLLLTSLYESRTQIAMERCLVHPVKKIPMLHNEITAYGADMNLLLMYCHLADDWKDERKLAGLAGMRLLKKKVGQIRSAYPRQAETVGAQLGILDQLEREGETGVDRAAGAFGRIMGEIFVYREDQWSQRLRRMGFYLGKFIYLSDAYEDLEQDLKRGRFNPLKDAAGREDFHAYCRELLTIMIGECACEFEKLPCLKGQDILRNILYMGVWSRYNQIRQKEKERGATTGRRRKT